MGTRIVRGRAYTDADGADATRVMVVSESMGRVLWPNADPLRQCIKVGADTMPCTTVIGFADADPTKNVGHLIAHAVKTRREAPGASQI
jgi:hypothetical protein